MKTMRASAPIILAAGLAAALCLLASSCSMPGTSAPASSSPPAVQITNYNGNFSYTVDAGSSAKDVYFVFSNTNLDTSTTGATVNSSSLGAISVDGVDIATMRTQPAGGPAERPKSVRDAIDLTNRDIRSSLGHHEAQVAASVVNGPMQNGVAGSSGAVDTFKDFQDGDTYIPTLPVPATCRYHGSPVSTKYGNRTLDIWVADDCWTGAGVKPHEITPAMVTELAKNFLVDGVSDIYGYVTGILGAEWGSDTGKCTFSNELISANGTITILLSDLEADKSDSGGVVGYFWAGNNFQAAYQKGTNERIMFAIDAVMYANPDLNGYSSSSEYYKGGVWSTSSYWAKECFSTLAHEFQHMIQFYRKGILVRGDGYSANTWINEMCSLLVEDLVADKLGVEGPRGVDSSTGDAGSSKNSHGRIRWFNQPPILDGYGNIIGYGTMGTYSLLGKSGYRWPDYSFSYAFGSWLARNFGGANFVKNVVYDSNTDATCITNAVASGGGSWTISDLISRWAVAVLGSTRTDMPFGYRYNTGGWTSSSLGGLTYNLGSINFFNYNPAPVVVEEKDAAKLSKSIVSASNVYYLAKSGLTGSKTWKLKVPSDVTFSVYVTQ